MLNWIKVSERLPRNRRTVLVWAKTDNGGAWCLEAFYNPGTGKWEGSNEDGFREYPPTHWADFMPPEGESYGYYDSAEEMPTEEEHKLLRATSAP